MELDVRCEHERSSIPVEQTVSYYQPLTKAELQVLLQTASTTKFPLTNTIQVRLGQGIKGIECPHQSAGDVAERLSLVCQLYVLILEKRPSLLPTMVDTFYELMEGE